MNGAKLLYRDVSGKRQIVDLSDKYPASKRGKHFYHGTIARDGHGIISAAPIKKRAFRALVEARRKETNDPHLTLLPGSAFDAVAEMLDNPPAPSEGAKQVVGRARLWRR